MNFELTRSSMSGLAARVPACESAESISELDMKCAGSPGEGFASEMLTLKQRNQCFFAGGSCCQPVRKVSVCLRLSREVRSQWACAVRSGSEPAKIVEVERNSLDDFPFGVCQARLP